MPALTTKTCNGGAVSRLALPVEPLAPVDISKLVAWISAIGFEEWPQQDRLDDGQIRPSMVTDLAWHGFGRITDAVVRSVLPAGSFDYQRMLSVVMPGHAIPSHRDWQAPYWAGRVHVPLTTNDRSRFIVGGIAYSMMLGMAYLVDTEIEHSVVNDGEEPRIHFMFDVRRG